MDIELAISVLLLLALTFLAAVDMAFEQLSDVGLRRLAAEAEEHPNARYAPFLKEVLDNRARFSFSLSAAIQILLVIFSVLITHISLKWSSSLSLLISLAVALVLAGIFSPFLSPPISLLHPVEKLFPSFPLLQPVYRLLALSSGRWHRSLPR